ncbi:uncharacterized protein [Lolium perenne]|uniref:uncharacterized protein n=1 Tax=Lolium perenne TaxID=4522 RepID=UPI0021F640BA|nr:uncharacterized protein LOC127339174 [Lolium perenne]
MEALSPYITNARRTVIEIEALVAVAVGLLFLQLILGPLRRRSGHWFIQGTLWLAYTLPFPLIAYNLGQMVSSPAKNGLYFVWAIILLWAAGCADSMTAYDLEDNKQWKRYLFQLLQYIVYAVAIERLLVAHTLSFNLEFNLEMKEKKAQPIQIAAGSLFAVLMFTNVVKAFAGWMVTRSYPSKLVADYVSDQVDERGDQDSFDPITMKGYKYLVRWRVQHHEHHYIKDGIITIDTIWDTEFNDGLLNTSIAVSQLKDVCLSFALSNLLKRRFFGMECAEAALPETRKFIFEGLLSSAEGEVNNYTRVFHIIEVELGFLYDFFFTKYAALFQMEGPYLVLVVLKSISICICGAVLLRNSPIVKTLDPIIEVGTRPVDITITVMVFGTLFLVEVLQVILYLMSDWATVSLACSYTRRGSWDFTTSVIWFLRRLNLFRHLRARYNNGKFLQRLNFFGYWQNKMGQSSVIHDCRHFDMPFTGPLNIRWFDNLLIMAFLHFISYMTSCVLSMVFSKKFFVLVPDSVKSEILSCLKKSSIGVPLTNGEAALQRNGVLGEFSWALKMPSQAKIIAIWHVATDYCNIGSHSKASEGEELMQIDYYNQVATTLSRYCAYLMSSIPDFLPGNSIDTHMVFDKLKEQSRRVLRAQKPSRDLLLRAIDDPKNSNQEDTIIRDYGGCMMQDTTIDENTQDDCIRNNMQNSTVDESTATNSQDNMFIEGLKLGRDLEKIEDEVLRWKVMAEFWAETIIYIAPSDNIKLHMERLAQGGEFLTHVWALLTHAGILKRDQKQAPEDNV